MWEGDYAHKNMGEESYTSRGGIYKYAHPDAPIFKYYDQIADELGVSMRESWGREVVNSFLRDEPVYREVEEDLIWLFYVEEFLQPKEIIDILDPKSSLTYFSINVNGGRYRGGKALQTAINDTYERYQMPMKIRVDGDVGRNTIKAISNLVGNGYFTSYEFNQSMIEYMRDFYQSLVEKKPEKYAIFLSGWNSRLDALV
jgi:hypothetical protein